MQIVQLAETLVDLLGDVYGAGVGKAAEIQPRATDHVCQQADVGGRQLGLLEGAPQREQIVLRDMGQDQILVMGDADLGMAVFVGQGGNEVHLFGGGVARRRGGMLE